MAEMMRSHLLVPRPAVPRGHRGMIAHSIPVLVMRLTRESPRWGYRRLHGEPLVLAVKESTSTVWEILREAVIEPAPERSISCGPMPRTPRPACGPAQRAAEYSPA
jgi:putative transposase